MENSNLLPMRWGQGSENNIEDKRFFNFKIYVSSQYSKNKIKFNIRRDQVNLLVYRPDWPYFKQKPKIILQNFGQMDFLLIYYFLLFEKNKKWNTTNL